MFNKKYNLYPKAVIDLEKIYLYGYDNFGHKKSEEYIKNIESSFHHIANNPDCARNCDYIERKLLAWNVGSHVVFFKKKMHGISVIRVLHKSMDYVQHL